MTKKKKLLLLIIGISILFGWIMSFPYEGPVFFALAGDYGVNESLLNLLSVLFHAAGLFCGGILAGKVSNLKKVLLLLLVLSFFLSILIPFLPASVIAVVLPFVSFLMGIEISGHAPFLQEVIPYKRRTQAAAFILILGNLILILADILSSILPAVYAFIIIELLFAFGIFLLRFSVPFMAAPRKTPIIKKLSLKSFSIFYLFIFIITINSGIMFSVIYPYFGEFELLTSIYTNIPYIIAILILSFLSGKIKFRFFHIGLLLWALSFVLFALLPSTPLTFLLICTLMLFACGIYDIFWWGVMFENFELVRNPSMLLGLGLAINVFGVFIGSLIGQFLLTISGKHLVSIFGLLFIVLCSLIVIPLNIKLTNFLTGNDFLMDSLIVTPSDSPDTILSEIKKLVTKREYEVFLFLMSGKSDKEICDVLFIAKSTLKTHNRSIYKKLEVADRRELIDKYECIKNICSPDCEAI